MQVFCIFQFSAHSRVPPADTMRFSANIMDLKCYYIQTLLKKYWVVFLGQSETQKRAFQSLFSYASVLYHTEILRFPK